MASHSPPVVTREHVPLHALSTIGVGGPARWFARAETNEDVRAIHQWCVDRDLPLFILGGGSNIIVSDDGFDGLVLSMAVSGLRNRRGTGRDDGHGGRGRVVGSTGRLGGRDSDLSGVECLSGIPGTVGGTPIQNVGAYGQEVAGVIDRVTVFDSHALRVRRADCC